MVRLGFWQERRSRCNWPVRIFHKQPLPYQSCAKVSPSYSQSNEVDVRDLAAAHVLSISVEEAGNNRFAISKQPYTWQICLDEVANDDKVKKAWPKIPTGKPGADKVEDQNRERSLYGLEI